MRIELDLLRHLSRVFSGFYRVVFKVFYRVEFTALIVTENNTTIDRTRSISTCSGSTIMIRE